MNMRKLIILLSVIICMSALSAGALAEAAVITRSEVLLYAGDPDGYTSSETPLGSFAADAVRELTQADLTVLCSGDLGEDLKAGEITAYSLEASFPGDSEILVITVSAARLRDILEAMVADVVLNEEERIDKEKSESARFPQISGFTFIFDAPSVPGDRVTSITPDGGDELNLGDTSERRTLAVSSKALDGAGLSGLAEEGETAGRLRDIVGEALARTDVLSGEPSSGRIKVTGAYENLLISSIPTPLLIICVVLMLIFSGTRYRNRYKDER